MPEQPVDVFAFNRAAWDCMVAKGNRWTQPVDAETVRKARQGEWSVVLTPTRAVPRSWFPELSGCRILALAAGGGQQGPIFAAAGAQVTVWDASGRQLAQDRAVAARDGLDLRTIEGSMDDLGSIEDESFDVVFHPCSNCFCPDVLPVWREVARVLRTGGILMAGFLNPAVFAVDEDLAAQGRLQLVHPIPHSDAKDPGVVARRQTEGRPLEFGHSLSELIGGQLASGFRLTDLYEDRFGGADSFERAFDRVMAGLIATRAVLDFDA